MPAMPEGTRRLCVAYDIERYSGRGTRGEFAAQGRLAEALEAAFGVAGIGSGLRDVQEQGDGGIALLPVGGDVDEPRLLVSLLRGLAAALGELNEDLVPKARIRLRVGLSEGVVHRAPHGYAGPAVTAACRLRDAGATRQALAASTAADLVVVVTDGLYRDVLAHGYHGLPGSAFSKITVDVKEFVADAWIYLPGSPGSQAVSPQEPGQAAADPGRADAVTLSDLLRDGKDMS